jgi:hypothetical protein
MSRATQPANEGASSGPIRSRRALLAGATGAVGAVAASSLAGAPAAEASTDKQFTATGPAGAGFLAKSNSIQFGADLQARLYGARAVGKAAGVVGIGTSGRGGDFHSGDLRGQIRLSPQIGPGGPKVTATPSQYAGGHGLPAAGASGDFWFTEEVQGTTEVRGSGTLWLCVASSIGKLGSPTFQPAIWREVLLGSPFAGDAVPFD